jgi:tetratricopeptide (TPR) repeat protein
VNRDLAKACDLALGAGGELLALVAESAFPARRNAGGETSSRILVTSRGRLPALDDAWHFPVGVLPLDDSVRLLRSVAGDHAPDDAVATEIVRYCGQLPLAVRIVIDALSSLAWARRYRGEAEPAVADLTTVLAGYRRTSRTRNVVIALRGIALASVALGRFPEAPAAAEEATGLAQLPVDRAMSVNCEAWIHFRASRWDEESRGYQRAAAVADDAGSEYERARALTGRGNTAAARGDRTEAERWWAAAAAYRVTLDPAVLGEAEYRNRPTFAE